MPKFLAYLLFMHKHHLPKFLALLLIAIHMTGCSSGNLEYTRYYVNGWGGIVNDSMALFAICTEDYYYEDASVWGTGGVDEYVFRGYNLTLADIRTQKIYWQKEIPVKNCNLEFNYMQDSILFFVNAKIGMGPEIVFLNLGNEKFQQPERIELKHKKIDLIGEGWRSVIEVRVRPWRDGLLLANSFHYSSLLDKLTNYYALLDTLAKTMELWEPSGELGWLNECADAKWSQMGGLCLKWMPDTLGFMLLKNGIDTLAIRYMPYKLSVGEKIYSNPLIFSRSSIISYGWIYLMNENGIVSENPLYTWMYHTGIFFNLHGDGANYNRKIVY